VVAHYPVPIQEDIRDLLVTLLGRGVAADKVSPLVFEDDDPGAIAEFLTDDDRTAALCMFDGAFAVRAGAALVMVPSAAAEEDLGRGDIEPHLEVAQEVVNVLSKLMNSASTPHLRLGPIHRVPGELPDGVVALLERPEYRRDFAVHIDGYGEGRFSLLVD
jgi:hypothetical protein